jgi:hypothetical protein
LHCQPNIAEALVSQRKELEMVRWTRLREEELVERLYEAADAIEDEDTRDAVYKAITAALEVWAPESLKRAQSGELAPV